MKKEMKNRALMAAVLFTGAFGFAACSSDDASDPVNPTFDGKSVKTQFAINIPHSSPAGSRMTEENTQANKNFLGMNEIRLLPFTGVPGTVTTISSMIVLPNIASDAISISQSSKVYNDVNVPVGTDHFLFYATAPYGRTPAEKFQKGILEVNVDGKTSIDDVTFNLVNTEAEGNTAETEKTGLLNVLNAVASVDVSSATLADDLKKNIEEFKKLQAGSANSILATLQSLYQKVNAYATGADGENKTVAVAVQNAIKTNNVFTVVADTDPIELTTTYTYPKQLNLPDGAVVVSYSTENGNFTYGENTTIGTTPSTIDITKVCYPASLYYFQNTDIATSNTIATWPETTTAWAAGFTGWGSTVESTTSAIALKQNINYAVSNLKLTVKCGGTTLKDYGTTGQPASYVTVPSAGFPVSAILIGGQPETVDWQFEPAGNFNLTVYDKELSGVNAKANAAEGVNHTLVLPNKASEKKPVNFALELTNNSGVEFRGYNGQIIPKNGKFYLVGTLNPADKTVEGVTNPDVFMSDYVTTANVTITSLENAYNVIPDLRATRMELGLSVDLEWKAGIVFDVDIK